MYEAFFGFSRRPFVAVPSTEHYFAAGAVEGARQNLARAIERGEGAGMVVGPSGTGKTLLTQVLAAQFRSRFEVALLTSGRLSSRRALLQAILYELKLPYRNLDEGELRLALVDHLTGDSRGRGMLLLLDEAHLLPIRLLEEVRMLTNLAAATEPAVRLVLAGNCELEERFASPRLESFSQRVVARCYLEAFSRGETEQYIHHQLAAAGVGFEAVFNTDACHAVYQATSGIPRLVNQLCDHALMLSCVAARSDVSAACIQEAWSDLQQLPTPWNADSQPAVAREDLIEFGGLDDEPGEAAPESHHAGRDEPLEQLDRIQQSLSAIDREFEPAARQRPEVELIFDDPNDPFGEAFEEEEVLVDRAPAHAGAMPLSPPVETSTSEAATVTLAAILAQPPIVGEIVDAALSACVVTDVVAPFELPVTHTEGLVVLDFPAAAETGAAPVAPPAGGPEIVVEEYAEDGIDDGGPQTVRLRRARPVRPRARDDGDLIIVEEGTDEGPASRGPLAPVRRQEYRRLFAQLRQG